MPQPFNISQFKMTRPTMNISDFSMAKTNLGVSNTARGNAYSANGGSWNGGLLGKPQDTLPNTTASDGTTGGKVGSVLKDTSTGLAKGGLDVAIDTASGLQGLGKWFLSKIPGLGKYAAGTGIGALDTSTPEGQGVKADLAANSKAEEGGKIIGEIGASVLGPEESEEVGAATKKVSDTVASMGEKSTAETASKDALDIISPKLSKTDTEKALAAGRGEGGGLFSKTKISPDKLTTDTAEAVKGIVKKGASGADNINNIRTALSTEAENLKTQIQSVDHPYVFKELQAKLNDIETPISIRGTAFEKQVGAVKDAAMQIAKDAGGKVSSLLDARKGFDALVQKEYPKLYETEYAPMKAAITSIRNAMNDFIEENLPDDVSLKDSLHTQSLYYNAIDNIAEKSTGEVGKTGLARKTAGFIRKHPVISGAAGAMIGEGALNEGKKIIGAGN